MANDIPANQDTRGTRQGWVTREIDTEDDHIEITNSGSAIKAGDFVMKTPYFGLADGDIPAVGDAPKNVGDIHVGQIYRAALARIGSAQTFATWGQAVYYDPADGKFYEATDSGRILVGYVRELQDTTDGFGFEGLKHHGPIDLST